MKSKILKFDLDGKNLGEIELPSIGTARGFSGKKDDKEVVDVLNFGFSLGA